MSGDYTDGEGSVGPDADFVDVTIETEVELRLPLEVDMKPDQPCEDVPTYSGAVDLDAVDFGQDEHRRFEPPSGAKPKWPRHRLPLPIILEPQNDRHIECPEMVAIGRERPIRHTRDLPNADRMPG